MLFLQHGKQGINIRPLRMIYKLKVVQMMQKLDVLLLVSVHPAQSSSQKLVRQSELFLRNLIP